GKAREKGRQAVCISNLKQLTISFFMYSQDNDDYLPPAYYYNSEGETGWDFSTDDWWMTYRPGILGGYLSGKVFECPSRFGLKSYDRPFTGYAYNATYLGGGYSVWDGQAQPPVLLTRIRNASGTILLADSAIWTPFTNELIANNVLRAPGDTSYYYGPNVYFRHNGFANAAFCDGHVESIRTKYNESSYDSKLGDLSADDSMYDLE
ncbi:MAG: DUF1559 domain-containing protein, partial [Candidatus Omnitrophica bacterium]|nr:DUF1559 domain-containing protein [Candidatus Omnitrophota bacterium]